MNIIKVRIFESIVLQSKPLHSRTKPIPTMKMRTQLFRQCGLTLFSLIYARFAVAYKV